MISSTPLLYLECLSRDNVYVRGEMELGELHVGVGEMFRILISEQSHNVFVIRYWFDDRW